MIIEITLAMMIRRSALPHLTATTNQNKRNSIEQKAQGESVVATFPSFMWINEPRFEVALQYLQPAGSMGTPASDFPMHTTVLTAGYRRWAEDLFISQVAMKVIYNTRTKIPLSKRCFFRPFKKFR